MEKTEYRIIPHSTFIGDLYLQFKTIDEKTNFFGTKSIKESWRFVPEDGVAKVLGYFLHASDCPTKLTEWNESRFQSCFTGQENYSIGGLIPFTKKYPNIEVYFEELRSKRKKYIEEEENKKNNKNIIYL